MLLMRVGLLQRYPVKSMLGEVVDEMFVDQRGAEGDRRLALLDVATGRVASAKQPRLWRGLLQFTATGNTGSVRIELPDGRAVAANDPRIDELLSGVVGRTVRLISRRPQCATVERPDPEDVLEQGVDAELDSRILEIGQGTPGDSFVDDAPLHLITAATLERIDTEATRYRPNLVINTPPGYPAYAENDWEGRELSVGDVRLRVLSPTPRCALPTLEHGPLPRAPHAVRVPAAENRVPAGGFGILPCAGAYAEVITEGTIRTGDPVTLH